MVPTTNIISGLQELCKEVKFSFHEMKEYSVLSANEGKVYMSTTQREISRIICMT